MGLGLGLAILLYGLVVLRTAWLSEDAFITFRTVDNFIHGYGLTWNVTERVQAYTHPLWMLLVSACYFFTREIYFTSILFSLAVSLAAVYVLTRRIAVSAASGIWAVTVLLSSKAFVDYSTSGLENPLTHLLLVLFAVVYLRIEKADPGRLLALGAVVGLLLLNRMDLALIVGPASVWVLWNFCSWRTVVWLAAGTVPFVIWIMFSLFYYGFPFPNTAYAKLGIGVGAVELWTKGGDYLLRSCRNDPLTPLVILAGVGLPLVRRDGRLLALVAGGPLYLAYVIRIGGDYMAGRFFTAPFMLSIIIVCSMLDFKTVRGLGIGCGLVLILGISGPYSSLLSDGDYGVGADRQALIDGDIRGVDYPFTGLLRAFRVGGEDFPNHWWAVRGRKVRAGDLDPRDANGIGEGFFAERSSVDGRVVTTWNNVGMSGFYAGPDVHIVDMIALAEPLLARLPAKEDPLTGAGHYGRIVPDGYLATRLHGVNVITDKGLARYYEKLNYVIAGDLFDTGRLKEIWRLNTGQYEQWLDWHRYRHPTPVEEALSAIRIRPGNPQKYIDLAKAYFATGEDAAAIDALDRGLALNRSSFKNHFIAALALGVHGLAERAKLRYRQAIQLAPAYISGLDAEREAGLVAEARKCFIFAHRKVAEASSRDEMSEIYKRMIEQPYGPTDGYFQMNMGRFFDKNEQVKLAKLAYRKVLEADPGAWQARVNYGWNLYLSGDFAGAARQYLQVLAEEENSVAAFNLALAYLAMGREDEARKAYVGAIARYGKAEARRIGAIDDLHRLVGEESFAVADDIITLVEAND